MTKSLTITSRRDFLALIRRYLKKNKISSGQFGMAAIGNIQTVQRILRDDRIADPRLSTVEKVLSFIKKHPTFPARKK